MRRRNLLLAAPALLVTRTAQAAWPERPLRLVVPFAAGGGVDLTGRLMAEALERRLGQSVVVDNRTGAGGAIGMQAVATAAPDGHTLVVTSPSTITVGPQLRPSPYDPFALTHVTRVCTSPLLLVCRPSLPARDFAEFIALARRAPATLKMANAGQGTVLHFAAELFNLKLGVQRFVHIPYRGAAPALADVIAGTADAIFSDSSTWQHVESGQLRLLAVTLPQRWPRAPQVPTVAETMPGFEAVNWYGLGGPGGVPAEVATRIAAESAAALAEPALQRRLTDIGFDAAPLAGEPFVRGLRAEAAMWGDLIKAANIRPD